MGRENKIVTLPNGPVPKTVGFDVLVSMQINDIAVEGWRAVSIARWAGGNTPLTVLFERDSNA